MAVFYNAVLDRFNATREHHEAALTQLDRLANYDELTGLANRRMYFDTLRRAVARSERSGQRGRARGLAPRVDPHQVVVFGGCRQPAGEGGDRLEAVE